MDPSNSINPHGLYTPLPIPFAPLTNLLRTMIKKINDNAYEIDLPSNKYALSSTFKVGQVTSNTLKGPMTRAQARQLNNEVKSLLLESRFDISGSWILPHASYVCLISFAGKMARGRMTGRQSAAGCSKSHWRSDRQLQRSDRRQTPLAVRPQYSPVRPAPTSFAGFRPSPLAVRPPATPVRPAPAVRPP